MRRMILLLMLFFVLLAVPAHAETINDYAALTEAFNTAQEDVTLTLGADLLYDAGGSCILNNPSKAVVTIDGNGHTIDYIALLDGSLVLEDLAVTEHIAISSAKKSNTTSVVISADASVGWLAGGISIPQDALGTIHIRNEGRCSQVSSTGCAAKINIENTGLIEAILGISISDQRYAKNYSLAANGDVTIVNDGVIRGLTSAGVILALGGGTDAKITGSGYIEGPCGVVVFCQKARANVVIDHDIRTCNAAFAANPAQYADLWYMLGERGSELNLPRTTGEMTLTPEYQRRFRIAQLDMLFNLCVCDGQDVIGRALVLPQTDDEPYNGKITVTGRLYGEEGLVVLPDMNLYKGAITIKSTLDETSPSQLIDVHYAVDLDDVTAAKWSKKLSSFIKKLFPSSLPESSIVRTWGVRHDEETGGIIYTTDWQSYAMDELRAVQTEGKGKWSVTTYPMPAPGGTMTRYDVGDQLSGAQDNAILYLESDVTSGALDSLYNRYIFAGSDIIIDGQGHHFVNVSEEKHRAMYPVEFTMNDGITLRNFGVYDGLRIRSGKYTKGTAVLENITALRGLWLQGVNAELRGVMSENDYDSDISIFNSTEYVQKATVTIDADCALYGFAQLSSGGNAKHVNTLHIVNHGVLSRDDGMAWNGSLTASHKSTLKITGDGVLGNLENDDPEHGHYDVRAYADGKIIIDHTVASLNIIAGVDQDSSYSPKGSVTIGGSCRFLSVECEDNAQKCSITITATGVEVFRVLMEAEGRTEPMTDQEAAAFIKKNSPKMTYKKATSSTGESIVPTYRITGEDNALLWEGSLE